LGQAADLIVIAPATAHVIARVAAGLANDLLTATVLASRAPVLLCPAMHTEMWEQPSVQSNLETLRSRGITVLPPVSGHLAGGDDGMGRLPEPEAIAAVVTAMVRMPRGPLSGRRVVVSAGGTSEAIDPVRVLTNRSSGHQGYAIAEVASRLGAEVTLVSAATREVALDVRRHVTLVPVTSAEEMRVAVLEAATGADVVIMAAAVADFTVDAAPDKLKKADGVPTLALLPTVDIVAELLARKSAGQLVVAFAAETSDVRRRAEEKLARKPVDFLVLNDVLAPGTGFGHATNAVTILRAGEPDEVVPLTSKEAVASHLLTRVVTTLLRGES
jgi:phosphopantothenoylcysteine decarboxylase/phosphopantothenate--cysteine ligase